MGKNEDEVKTTLRWRLQSLPTGDQVAKLVEQEVITTAEARAILFKEVDSGEQIKALEEQVQFLRDLIKDLSKNQSSYIAPVLVQKYIEYVPRYSWQHTPWGGTTVLCGNLGLTGTSAGSGLAIANGYGSTGTLKATSTLS